MATRLDNLSIDEVSGVDMPANDTPGWLVMKSRDVDTLERTSATLYAALAGADDFLSGAPEEIVKARDTLETFLTDLLTEEPKRETLVSKVRSMFARRQEQERTAAELEQEIAKSYEALLEDVDVDAEADIYDEEPQDHTPHYEDEEDTMEGFEEFGADEEYVKASELDGLRDVLGAVLDRMESIEKALAGPTALHGQEDRNVAIEKAQGGTLRDAILSAARGNKVSIR